MKCWPAVRDDTVIVASPLVSVAFPSTCEPSLNCTLPVGVPPGASGCTSALSTTGCPCCAGFVQVITNVNVDIAALRTVTAIGADVVAAKFVDPAYAAVIA